MRTNNKPTPGSAVIDILRLTWDSGDDWGSASEAAWAVAVVAWAVECQEAVAILEYRPSPMGSPTMEDLLSITGDDDVTIQMNDIATSFAGGSIIEADLIFAAKVIKRYRRMLNKAGRSY